MAESSSTPLARWLFQRGERQQQAWNYWIRDSASGVLNSALHYAMRALPIDVCSQLGAWMGSFAQRRHKADAAPLRHLWAEVRPDATPAEVEADIARLWRGVGRSMAEFSVVDRLHAAGRISIEGAEHLIALRDAGKSRLVVALHLGNWEVLLPALAAVGQHGTGIYMPPNNRFEHAIAVKVRARSGFDLIGPGPASGRATLRALQNKDRQLYIFVDEFIRGRVQAPAFGRAINASSNLAYAVRLAAMTGAEIIPCFGQRLDEKARFKVTFLPPVALQKSDDADADRAVNIARLNDIIEPIVRAHLDQWYFGLYFDRFD